VKILSSVTVIFAGLSACSAFARSDSAKIALCSQQAMAASVQVVLEDPNVVEVVRFDSELTEMPPGDALAPVFKVGITASMLNGRSGDFSFRVRTLYKNAVCRFVAMDNLSNIDFGPDHPCDAVKDGSLQGFCMAEHTKDRERCRSIVDPNWKSFCLRRSPGDSYSCEDLRDESFRYYCYALTRNSAIPCFQVPNGDMGRLCYGHVQKDESFCDEIGDASLRQLCISLQKPLAPN
jgi:hypothetical protein